MNCAKTETEYGDTEYSDKDIWYWHAGNQHSDCDNESAHSFTCLDPKQYELSREILSRMDWCQSSA